VSTSGYALIVCPDRTLPAESFKEVIILSMTKATQTSPRKAAANRRNASKSTGPRTAKGKSRSRLNALKHGILASQAVISTIEGSAERKLFEATVAGLADDFQPVGTYEQLLVQEIAACFWRLRRLHKFENHAAAEVRGGPIRELINRYPEDEQPPPGRSAFYLQRGMLATTEQVYDEAGLSGISLPNEADTMRVIRYQAAIIRTRERAVKSLREMRKDRGRRGVREPAPPAIDRAAARRDASGGEATLLPAMFSVNAWHKFEEVVDEGLLAQEAELRGQMVREDKPADQTKPKDIDIEDMKRGFYRAMYGREMPEESAETPATPEKAPDQAPEQPKTS